MVSQDVPQMLAALFNVIENPQHPSELIKVAPILEDRAD